MNSSEELSAEEFMHGNGCAHLVSIIVLTFNHEAFIDECIASCVQQHDDYPHLEIVVADDGSCDSTPEKIRQWASKHPDLVRPVLAEQNAGIAENFNQGIRAAQGTLVAWLGGDDVMLPGKIGRQVQLLSAHPEAAGCYHDAEVFAWPSGKTLGVFSELYAGKAASAQLIDVPQMLDPRYQMLPSTIMVRRRAMPNAYDVRLRFHNDFLFDVESIIAGGPYVRMEGVLARYRKHEKSIGRDPRTVATMLEENLIVCAILEARYPGLARRINRRAVYYLSLEAIRSFKQGNPVRTRALCKAIVARGAPIRALIIALAGPLLTRLTEPRYRRLAIRLRSLFG